MSYDCHLVNDRDVSSAYCRCSTDDSVVLFVPPWSVVSDWCISDYFAGKYQLVINVTYDDLTGSEKSRAYKVSLKVYLKANVSANIAMINH